MQRREATAGHAHCRDGKKGEAAIPPLGPGPDRGRAWQSIERPVPGGRRAAQWDIFLQSGLQRPVCGLEDAGNGGVGGDWRVANWTSPYDIRRRGRAFKGKKFLVREFITCRLQRSRYIYAAVSLYLHRSNCMCTAICMDIIRSAQARKRSTRHAGESETTSKYSCMPCSAWETYKLCAQGPATTTT